MEGNTKNSTASGFGAGSLIFVAIAIVLVGVSALFGFADLGAIPMLLGSISLVLAVAHRWHRPRRFVKLLIGSLVGFVVSAVLHNLCYGVGKYFEDVAIVHGIFEFLHVVFFLAAVMLCPAGALVGAAGAVITWIKTRKTAQA
jgi:hypothetical protein